MTQSIEIRGGIQLVDGSDPYFALSIMCANNRVHSDLMVVLVCLRITLHHYQQSYLRVLDLHNAFQVHSVEWGYEINSIILVICHAIYGAVYIQLTHSSYDECEIICTLSYYHHQIGSMTHLPLFRVSLWNNGMCCIFFYYQHLNLYIQHTKRTSKLKEMCMYKDCAGNR